MAIIRIAVLGAAFFAVALCPNVATALIVFALGTAFYFLSWGVWLYEKRKK